MAEQEEQAAPAKEEEASQDEAAQNEDAPDAAAQDGDEQPQAEQEDGESAGEAPAAGDGAPVTEGAAVVAAQATVSDDVLAGRDREEGRNMRKERVGVVVSDKMEKTIVVSIERSKKHPMYQKYLTRTARKMAHDENNDAGEGDTVRIMETRPISKHKRWRLVEILERAA